MLRATWSELHTRIGTKAARGHEIARQVGVWPSLARVPLLNPASTYERGFRIGSSEKGRGARLKTLSSTPLCSEPLPDSEITRTPAVQAKRPVANGTVKTIDHRQNSGASQHELNRRGKLVNGETINTPEKVLSAADFRFELSLNR